jgi:hypothetical protein
LRFLFLLLLLRRLLRRRRLLLRRLLRRRLLLPLLLAPRCLLLARLSLARLRVARAHRLLDASSGALDYLYRSVALFPDGAGYALGSVEGRATIKYLDGDAPTRTRVK